MKQSLAAVFLVLAATNGQAAGGLDAKRLMAELAWEKRVLLLFSKAPGTAALQRQNDILQAAAAGLAERDMAVIRVFADNRVTLDGRHLASSGQSFYDRFGVDPAGFRVMLVGKDGTVKMDRSDAVSAEDLFQLIDAMPMRRLEMSRDG